MDNKKAVLGQYFTKKEVASNLVSLLKQYAHYSNDIKVLEPSFGKGSFIEVLKDSPEAAALAGAENQDREVIYQAIAGQNQLGSEGLAKVRSVFAEVQRGKAKPDEFIQLASGEWVQK